VCFGPGAVEKGVLRVKPTLLLVGCLDNGKRTTHHFSATIPFAVKPSIYSRPLPTRPKFADVATAMRESKKGEYLTLYPL
jgi:hypothetical protein